MAYERLNLADGDVLKAEHLAHMEDALAQGTSWGDVAISNVYWCENESLEMYEGDFGIMSGGFETTCEPPTSGVYTATVNGVVHEGKELRSKFFYGDEYFFIGNWAIFVSSNEGVSITQLIADGVISEEDDTGESFFVMFASYDDASVVSLATTDTANPATLSLYGPSVQPIEEQYLPKDVLKGIPYTLEIYNDGSDWVVDGWEKQGLTEQGGFTRGTYLDINDAFNAKRPVVAYIWTGDEDAIVPMTSNGDDCYVFHSPYAKVNGTYGAHTWFIEGNDGYVTFE